MKLIWVFLLVLTILKSPKVGANGGFCRKMYNYCLFEGSDTGTTPPSHNAGPIGRVGKSGPPGPMGLSGRPAVVNYTVINSNILEQVGKYLYPSDCDDVNEVMKQKGWDGPGALFDIYPPRMGKRMEVYCDLTTDGGGWTVFQRREDGSVDFYRVWDEYVNGFGQKEKEFWLGLEAIYQMTKNDDYMLRVDMMDWDGNTAYAEYTTFSLGDINSKYRINVGGYRGTAGGDSLLFSNSQMFTTIDSDNDNDATNNCAVLYKGAWWHNACHLSNLNGLYVKGGPAAFGVAINWKHWKGYEYSLKFTEMKIRKKN